METRWRLAHCYVTILSSLDVEIDDNLVEQVTWWRHLWYLANGHEPIFIVSAFAVVFLLVFASHC